VDIRFLAGLAGGGIITWLVAHVYYRKANEDQNQLYNKLSVDMRSIILQDSRPKLSIRDLKESMAQITIEDRRADIENVRMPIYADALTLIYEIENDRSDADRFEAARKRLCEWAPAKLNYLPPKAVELIFGVINRGAAYGCDLHNKEPNHNTSEWFREMLQAAKEFFLQNQDIRWLPEDRIQ
jgi:hypothetical protein